MFVKPAYSFLGESCKSASCYLLRSTPVMQSLCSLSPRFCLARSFSTRSFLHSPATGSSRIGCSLRVQWSGPWAPQAYRKAIYILHLNCPRRALLVAVGIQLRIRQLIILGRRRRSLCRFLTSYWRLDGLELAAIGLDHRVRRPCLSYGRHPAQMTRLIVADVSSPIFRPSPPSTFLWHLLGANRPRILYNCYKLSNSRAFCLFCSWWSHSYRWYYVVSWLSHSFLSSAAHTFSLRCLSPPWSLRRTSGSSGCPSRAFILNIRDRVGAFRWCLQAPQSSCPSSPVTSEPRTSHVSSWSGPNGSLCS